MKQSRKEFIIEAHKHACSEWKNKISDEFPKLFKENTLEAGNWYNVGHRYTICIDNVNGCRASIHGFKEGYWFESEDFKVINGCYKLTPATEKEVETALIKEAKKRGFRKGVNIITVSGNRYRLEDNEFCYDSPYLYLGGWEIFKKGEWATIIKTITKEQAEKELGKTILN